MKCEYLGSLPKKEIPVSQLILYLHNITVNISDGISCLPITVSLYIALETVQ